MRTILWERGDFLCEKTSFADRCRLVLTDFQSVTTQTAHAGFIDWNEFA